MTRVCKLKFEALERLLVVYIFLSSFHSYSQTFNKIFSFFLYPFSRVKMYEQINDCTF